MPTTTLTSLEQELSLRLEQAHSACELDARSSDCAVAWELVEEIHAAIADRKASNKSDLERFCDANPDDLECRIYEV